MIERTTAPIRAGKNPATSNPGTISVIAQNRTAFRMNANNPRVMIVMGSVRIDRTGRITIVITLHTSATKSVVVHPPEMVMPGTRYTVRYTAAAVPRNRRIIFIRKVCHNPRNKKAA